VSFDDFFGDIEAKTGAVGVQRGMAATSHEFPKQIRQGLRP